MPTITKKQLTILLKLLKLINDEVTIQTDIRGIRFNQMSSDHTYLINLFIPIENLEVKRIGLLLDDLGKILKSLQGNEVEFKFEDDKIIFVDGDAEYTIRTVDSTETEAPRINFEPTITINNVYEEGKLLSTYLKNMENFSEYVRFRNNNNKLVVETKSDLDSLKASLTTNIELDTELNSIYRLDVINLFLDVVGKSKNISYDIRNEGPIVIKAEDDDFNAVLAIAPRIEE